MLHGKIGWVSWRTFSHRTSSSFSFFHCSLEQKLQARTESKKSPVQSARSVACFGWTPFKEFAKAEPPRAEPGWDTAETQQVASWWSYMIPFRAAILRLCKVRHLYLRKEATGPQSGNQSNSPSMRPKLAVKRPSEAKLRRPRQFKAPTRADHRRFCLLRLLRMGSAARPAPPVTFEWLTSFHLFRDKLRSTKATI